MTPDLTGHFRDALQELTDAVAAHLKNAPPADYDRHFTLERANALARMRLGRPAVPLPEPPPRAWDDPPVHVPAPLPVTYGVGQVPVEEPTATWTDMWPQPGEIRIRVRGLREDGDLTGTAQVHPPNDEGEVVTEVDLRPGDPGEYRTTFRGESLTGPAAPADTTLRFDAPQPPPTQAGRKWYLACCGSLSGQHLEMCDVAPGAGEIRAGLFTERLSPADVAATVGDPPRVVFRVVRPTYEARITDQGDDIWMLAWEDNQELYPSLAIAIARLAALAYAADAGALLRRSPSKFADAAESWLASEVCGP